MRPKAIGASLLQARAVKRSQFAAGANPEDGAASVGRGTFEYAVPHSGAIQSAVSSLNQRTQWISSIILLLELIDGRELLGRGNLEDGAAPTGRVAAKESGPIEAPVSGL
jgi:hypothetical protein